MLVMVDHAVTTEVAAPHCRGGSWAKACTGLGRTSGHAIHPADMLDLEDLTLRIAGRALLEGATLHIPDNTRVGLVGRNGTGKSTLLRLMVGELQPDAGSLRMPAAAQDRHGRGKRRRAATMTPLEAVLAPTPYAAGLLQEAATAQRSGAASPRCTIG